MIRRAGIDTPLSSLIEIGLLLSMAQEVVAGVAASMWSCSWQVGMGGTITAPEDKSRYLWACQLLPEVWA